MNARHALLLGLGGCAALGALLRSVLSPSTASGNEVHLVQVVPPADAGAVGEPDFDTQLKACREDLDAGRLARAYRLCSAAELKAPASLGAEATVLIEEIDRVSAAIGAANERAASKPFARMLELDGAALKFSGLQLRVAHELVSNHFGSGSTEVRARAGTLIVGLDADIGSAEPDPALPCVIVATQKKGDWQMRMRAKANYVFRRWDSYESYLGTKPELGNDFASTGVVKFLLEAEIDERVIKQETL